MWPIMPLLALLVVLASAVPASAGYSWDYFPVKSQGDAQKIQFYVAPPEGTFDLEDAHPVHGIETSDGGFVLVGKGDKGGKSEGFAAKLDKAGKFEWAYVSDLTGDNALNSVVQLPGGGDVVVAGYHTENSVAKRMLAKLPLTSTSKKNQPIWVASNFGDKAEAHGAFETIDLDNDKTGVLLGGVHKKTNTEEMSFKSYGNVPGGKAIVMRIPISALATAPTAQSATWTSAALDAGYFTVKAVRPLPNGNAVALLYGEEDTGNKQAALVELKSDGTPTQGPTDFGREHGEGTDLAVVPDGTGFAISGHGDGGVIGALSGRITRVSRSFAHKWSKSYRSAPTASPMKLIKNECWGIQALADGFVLACGTGLENCNGMSGTMKSNCQNDKPVAADTRAGAWPRAAAVWQSMAVRTDREGSTLWRRVDQYRDPDDAALGANGWEARSSASEHVVLCADGSLAFVQDEVSGIGLMKLEKPEASAAVTTSLASAVASTTSALANDLSNPGPAGDANGSAVLTGITVSALFAAAVAVFLVE